MKNEKQIIQWLFNIDEFEYINYWEIEEYGIGTIIRVPGWPDGIPMGKEEEFLKDLNKTLKKAKENKNFEVEECDGKIYSVFKKYLPLMKTTNGRINFF